MAAVSLGTALAPIRAAHQEDKNVHVYVTETRPLLQGSRLTAWELMRDSIPMTLITDSMAGYFMAKGDIDLVLVGSDRIVANGDFANKIGTYMLAVLAKENEIPFYAVAPTSTFDDATLNGEAITIEERDHAEVVSINGHLIAPHDVSARNPAFDVTPHRYLSGIVCEQGILHPPFEKAIAGVLQK